MHANEPEHAFSVWRSRALRPRVEPPVRPSVFLVEDDQWLRRSTSEALRQAGYAVRFAGTATAALRDILDTAPDVVVLDLGVTDIDGEQVLGMLRGVSAVPVIVAVADDDVASVIRLLEAGADDYVVKPYEAARLDARIRVVLHKTTRRRALPSLVVGGLEIDVVRREVTLEGVALDLTRLEFDLLAHLAARPGEVVSRRALRNEVWHQTEASSDKTVDVHLSSTRRKLGESAATPRYLVTVRGVGIKLVSPP